MMIGKSLDSLHRRLARSRFAVSAALKLRNQIAAVIRYSRASSIHAEENGEAWIVRELAPSCGRFVDVGANVGDWTALFLASMKRGGRGLLYEPSPSALAKLHARFDGNAAVEVIAAAAGANEGTIELYDFGDADQHSTVVRTAEAKGAQTKPVPLVTLDQDLERRGWPGADFVKIDAEGYDFRVLEGAAELLREQCIGVVQFEYNDSWRLAGNTLGFCVRFLESFGYRVYLLTNGALRPVEYDRFGEYFGYSNYVALSPARADDAKRLVRG